MKTLMEAMRAAVVVGVSAMVCASAGAVETARVQALKITVLSTMLADGQELGEWGFAALVEADGRHILFDTGAKTDVVRRNAGTLGIDLTTVPDVILSHSHWDHTGGFMTLRKAVLEKTPAALARTHVGEGIFYPRNSAVPGVKDQSMLALKAQYEATGGVFVSHTKAVQLYPGVWLTGVVPRKHPERNWSGSGRVTTPTGEAEDTLPEDMALVVDTALGLVVLTGCGHAGVINTIEHARAVVRPARVHALIGGVHLFNAKEATLAWTVEQLRGVGVDNLLGGHCTGIEVVYQLRAALGLDRAHAVVAAVGSKFELGKGIDARTIAK